MKTKKIIRQFTCTTKIEDTETTTKVSAIVHASYGKNYVLKVESKKFKDGKVIIDNTSHQYFNTDRELKTEFEYNFHICKNNIFTTSIEITK